MCDKQFFLRLDPAMIIPGLWSWFCLRIQTIIPYTTRIPKITEIELQLLLLELSKNISRTESVKDFLIFYQNQTIAHRML